MDLIETAERLATTAHAGQTDKAGLPYIEHPRRVAARTAVTSTDPDAVAVAWLHDVVEDTSVTLDELRETGFPETVIAAVDALTRRPDEGDRYYQRVAANPLAREVKLADIWDNTHPDRLGLLDADDVDWLTRKYGHALELLGARNPHSPGFPER